MIPASRRLSIRGAEPLALAVRAVASGAGVGKNLTAMCRIAGFLWQRKRRRTAAIERLADAFRAAAEIDVPQHRFHLVPPDGKCATVHAALHAAVDPLFQCADFVLARDVRREDTPNAGQWQAEAVRSGLEMAGLTIQTVAGVAHGRVGCVGTDQRRCFYD